MGSLKSSEITLKQQQELEHIFQRIEAELNASTISHQKRMDFEKHLGSLKKKFEDIKNGKTGTSIQDFEVELEKLDGALAQETIRQAEAELSKGEQGASALQALENVKHELSSKKIQPNRARHEVKEIMRKHL